MSKGFSQAHPAAGPVTPLDARQASILFADSATHLPAGTAGAVLVLGSHGAVHAVALAAQAGARASLHHDAGLGLDGAGVAGVMWADGFGMAAAAVAADSARIGDAADIHARGRISAVNHTAAALGVRPGQTASEALAYLCLASMPRAAPNILTRARAEISGVPCLDSISLLVPADCGRIIATGSHGGRSACVYGVAIAPRLVLVNDAGGAADRSGLGGLDLLAENNVAAAAVDAMSARIGLARSTLLDGIISHANPQAVALGARVGEKAAALAKRLLSLSAP